MVTVEHVETRAELAEAMAHARPLTAALVRRGHNGTHKSCLDCDRYAQLHDDLDYLIACWEKAQP